jgi:hypothetical protein
MFTMNPKQQLHDVWSIQTTKLNPTQYLRSSKMLSSRLALSAKRRPQDPYPCPGHLRINTKSVSQINIDPVSGSLEPSPRGTSQAPTQAIKATIYTYIYSNTYQERACTITQATSYANIIEYRLGIPTNELCFCL